jgi:hypothetical protein
VTEPAPPLRYIALGLIVVVFDTLQTSYDWLPDFLGWGIVLLGLRRFPGAARVPLTYCAAVAAVVAVVLFFPQVHEVAVQREVDLSELSQEELSLRWALLLPDLVFVALLLHAVEGLARPTQAGIATVLFVLKMIFAIGAVVPVVAAAADHREWIIAAADTVTLSWYVVLVLLFWISGREYAKPPAATKATGGS